MFLKLLASIGQYFVFKVCVFLSSNTILVTCNIKLVFIKKYKFKNLTIKYVIKHNVYRQIKKIQSIQFLNFALVKINCLIIFNFNLYGVFCIIF